MYEEEDDDLPMQYRRFSALHPGQPYSAFHERINNYMTGQIGMRNYLHEAIYNANQNAAQHRHFNTMMQQQQQQNGNAGFATSPSQNAAQPSWSPNQGSQPDSFSYSPGQQQLDSPTFTVPDAKSMSLSLPSPGSRRTASVASANQPSGSDDASQMPPPSKRSRLSFDDSDPFSSTLPINQQQLLDGNPSLASTVHASQLTPGVPMPSTYNYQFDPSSKANNTPGSQQFAFGHKMNLDVTLAPQNMHSMPYAPNSTASMSAEQPDFGDEASWFDDSSALFDFDQSTFAGGRLSHSGQVTPGDTAWNPDDFFDYNPAST